MQRRERDRGAATGSRREGGPCQPHSVRKESVQPTREEANGWRIDGQQSRLLLMGPGPWETERSGVRMGKSPEERKREI